MCYTSASAAKASAKEALANGTLILLAPPMVFFAMIAVVVYLYRNKFRDSADWQPEYDRELRAVLADLKPAAGQESPDARSQGVLEADRVVAPSSHLNTNRSVIHDPMAR